MNYPIWDIPSTGGGTLIAIIAVIHSFIAHFAVGGGLFLVLTEIKAYRDNSTQLLAYVRKHTKFFLLLTMVLGGVTGVGIWFIISLVNPAGTSILIHNFVFAWAIEWVFFIAEIVALLIYYYRFDQMSRRNHLILGWFYFGFAWLSLFVINGILGFMLNPGDWLDSQNMWSGLFNPVFWPSLFFRTGIALFIAGIFGLVTSVFSRNKKLKKSLLKYNIQWLYLPFILIVVSGANYYFAFPEFSIQNVFQYNNEATHFIYLLIGATLLIFLLGILFLFRLPSRFHKVSAFIMIVVGLSWMAGFEYLREIARKPFVLNGLMYSNSVKPGQLSQISEEGFLQTAKWTEIKSVNEENMLAAGKELFKHQCSSCHTLGGYNDIISRTNNLTERGLEAHLTGQGKVLNYMPPFSGTSEEKQALAAYIYREIHEKEPLKEKPARIQKVENEIPAFDPKKDKYVILSWNDLGMHCISDNDQFFSFLPPANTLWAQVVKRGPRPEVITEGITIKYEVEKQHQNPEDHVPFWDYEDKIFNAELEQGTGLTGNRVNGEFELNPEKLSYVAEFIPVTPYRDDGNFNPYPLFTVTAYKERTGEKLAQTKVVAPTSTEMGCRNCHGGGWRVSNYSGLSDETAENILRVHDRLNHTDLLQKARKGEPMLCQSCHGDPALGATGKKDVLNFSAAVHGFHANYLTNMKEESCALCHPADPEGNTSCNRGRHSAVGLNCTDCHGTLEDHAYALLKNEKTTKPEKASRLMAYLEPRKVTSGEEVHPRTPWLKEPDCLSCHRNFSKPGKVFKADAFNKWVAGGDVLYRNRPDNHGMMCAACHGSPHAVYFAMNPYNRNRDNLQPLQYQGTPGPIGMNQNCEVCHTQEMEVSGHHRNMLKAQKQTKPWERTKASSITTEIFTQSDRVQKMARERRSHSPLSDILGFLNILVLGGLILVVGKTIQKPL